MDRCPLPSSVLEMGLQIPFLHTAADSRADNNVTLWIEYGPETLAPVEGDETKCPTLSLK